MFEMVFPDYVGQVAAILVIISVIAYLFPSRLGERISDIALTAFVAVVLLGLVFSAPHFIGSTR